MSSAGSYMAKKGWNPGNKKNVEEVWVKQQKDKEQKKREEDRRREIEDERAEEELEKLQVEAGVKKVAGSVRWMYEGGGVTDKSIDAKLLDAKEREKFLLGQKTLPELNETQGTFGALEKGTTGVMAVTATTMLPASKRMKFVKGNDDTTTTNVKNSGSAAPDYAPLQEIKAHDRFVLSHEDPMAAMMMGSRNSGTRSSSHVPVGASSSHHRKHSDGESSSKKKHKKHHHHKKHKHSHRSSSSSSSSSD